MWNYGNLGRVCLKSLQHGHVSILDTYGAFLRGGSNLQQPCQERYVVGPFLLGGVPQGQRALDAGGISPEAFVFLVKRWDRASAGVKESLVHVTYSLLQHCATLAARDSSDQMWVVRRAAG